MRLPVLDGRRPFLDLLLHLHLGVVVVAVLVRQDVEVARQRRHRLQLRLHHRRAEQRRRRRLVLGDLRPQLGRRVVVHRERQPAHDVVLVAAVERVAEGGRLAVLRRLLVRLRPRRRRRRRRRRARAPRACSAIVQDVERRLARDLHVARVVEPRDARRYLDVARRRLAAAVGERLQHRVVLDLLTRLGVPRHARGLGVRVVGERARGVRRLVRLDRLAPRGVLGLRAGELFAAHRAAASLEQTAAHAFTFTPASRTSSAHPLLRCSAPLRGSRKLRVRT